MIWYVSSFSTFVLIGMSQTGNHGETQHTIQKIIVRHENEVKKHIRTTYAPIS